VGVHVPAPTGYFPIKLKYLANIYYPATAPT
jgi:hypothetical protein